MQGTTKAVKTTLRDDIPRPCFEANKIASWWYAEWNWCDLLSTMWKWFNFLICTMWHTGSGSEDERAEVRPSKYNFLGFKFINNVPESHWTNLPDTFCLAQIRTSLNRKMWRILREVPTCSTTRPLSTRYRHVSLCSPCNTHITYHQYCPVSYI